MRESDPQRPSAQGEFPVDAVMPELAAALARGGRAVLTASPGSGKTTRVPLALLGLLPGLQERGTKFRPLSGKVLVLEPRRLAARAAARYMARLLGEEVGRRAGYSVRLESRVSDATRVELLTEGVFTRRILADPELAGVSCVIFDEFHERGLQADLGLALCLECAGAFRPDLRLLAMSATLQAGELSRFLGGCPVIEAKGRIWPVEVRHAGRDLAVSPAAGVEEVAAKTARSVREVLSGEDGGVLAFLPGQAEIRRTAEMLEDLPAGTAVHALYGDLPPGGQDAAIAPPAPGRRKVVLATDIAQTSLTIEGVRVVIDAGLVRSPRFEPGTGLSRLVTGRLTKDAADQRAGRAGRLEPGLCLRLWPEQEHLVPEARPEILDADLTALYLDALTWGSEPEALPWITPPPKAALQNAAEALLALGAARHGPGNRLIITPHGQKLARLPLHPRLAHMVLRAAGMGNDLSSLAACLAAIVSERDPLRKNSPAEAVADIRLRLPLLRLPENRRLREAAGQILRLSGVKGAFRLPGPEDEDYSGMLLSLAWPERLAQRRGPGSFRLASGLGAELPAHDPLATEPWLAVAALGGNMFGGSGNNRRVFLAAPVSLPDMLRLHDENTRLEDEVCWDSRNEAVVSRSVKRLGALVLDEKPLAGSLEQGVLVKKALLAGIVSLGLGCLPWNGDLRQLQARVLMLRGLEDAERAAPDGVNDEARGGQNDGPNDARKRLWPDMSDAALLAGLEAGAAGDPESAWLAPWLDKVSRRAQFAAIDLGAALRAMLPWPLPDRLEKEAPERIALPSGSSARVDYLPVLRGEPPVLAVKLQEMFGRTDTPRIANGRAALMLHLLSPAGRPLQVTGDLRHFWSNAYKQVRAEMRGRYPRHPWPEDPLSAEPTGRTKKRLEKG